MEWSYFTNHQFSTAGLTHHNAHLLLATTSLGRRPSGNHPGRLPATKPLLSSRPRCHALLSFLVILLSWSSLFLPVAAAGDRLAWKGSSLVMDQRPHPMAPVQNNDIAAVTATHPTLRPRGTSDFTVPQAFDTGFNNNLTSTCASFLTKMRNNQAFQNCHPFSLLLQTSSAFFDASRSYLRITQTLDATCSVNAQQCKNMLDGYARDLVLSGTCKTDYKNGNALVIEAYNGLVAYLPAYQASCLRENDGRYCFANAVSNTSSTRDSLPYYLPVGQELPGGSRPTCNSCLQEAMGVFAHVAGNSSQPLSKTYTSAAQQISISCGKTFVNVAVAPLQGAAASAASASLTPTYTLILMFALLFLH